jgi:hypothetical protein
MCIVPNGRVRSSIHLLMPSSSQCGGAARKPYIPVSSLTPRAEEPIDEPLAWPIGLSPLLTRPDLSRPSRLCLVSARLFSTLLDSSRLCSTLLDSARLWSTLVDSAQLWLCLARLVYVSTLLNSVLTSSDLSRPPWLCLDRFDSARPLLDSARLGPTSALSEAMQMIRLDDIPYRLYMHYRRCLTSSRHGTSV